MDTAFLLVVGVVVFLVGFVMVALLAMSIYNRLIVLRNRYKNAWSQIDVQLKRRYDLIPNLVETAKGYIKHERQTLEAVIAARNTGLAAMQKVAQNPGEAGTMKELNMAEAGFSGALSRLLAVAEAYPDLKANQNMMQLSEELTSTENKVSFARQAYNDAVLSYNNAREVFPNNLLAGTFNFTSAELFEIAAPAEREAPKVSFN